MYIGLHVDSLTEEERYFNPIYLIVAQGKEHLKELLIRSSVCDCDTSLPNRRIGVFSVAADKYITFSQGNLQYFPAAKLWKFADTQYEYLGNANRYTSPTFRNWVDLFDWSADNAGNFIDWGTHNICGDPAGTWRTLSKQEWKYLLHDRSRATELLLPAIVENTLGVVVLPDNWVCPKGIQLITLSQTGAKWDNSQHIYTYSSNIYLSNVFSLTSWQRMEKAGAVFMPASGYINKDGVLNACGTVGRYWSSSPNSKAKGYYMSFGIAPTSATNSIRPQSAVNADKGHTVRLVHDTILPLPLPYQTFEVNGMSFNMMGVKGGTFMMGKGRSDAHQVTLSDYYIGETEVTCGLWKAVMGSLPASQSKYPDDFPVAHITLADCRQFAERLSELTGRHFRVPTEAEWEYAARGGHKSQGYLYAGSDDINEVAYWQGNVNRDDNGNIIHRPVPVKSRRPNELGVYDMTGNICEWVSDWHAAYNKYPQINPTGPAVPADPNYPCHYRGGCWTYTAEQSETTYRHGFYNRGANGIGLRLVMSDVEPFRAIYINDTTRFYLRPVEGGTFRMGVGAENYVEREGQYDHKDSTTHLVTLSSYHMTETAVTQGLWRAVMGTDIQDMVAASRYPDNKVKQGDAIPMTYVRLRDAINFIDRLNALTGLQFRLPTEAEFEYAARGGQQSHGYHYPGSNHADSVASASESDVAKKMPNELGIYDLTGCTREMCTDIWKDKYIYDSHVVNPVGPIQTSGNRVMRGGFHHGRPTALYDRTAYTPSWCGVNMGFRLVLPEEQQRKMVHLSDRFFEMVYVKGGSFMMGAAEGDPDAQADEYPQHQVTLSDYYIGQIEVTQQLWQTVMGSNPSKTKGNYLPVEQVTWDECQEFVARLSQLTGQNFRLPTEAEWEYAARGGNHSRGYRFAGGNGIDSVAWYEGNSEGKTHNVGTKLPNELGIYDMSGNAWEYCQDWYGYYSDQAQTNPTGPESGTYVVGRGGGFESRKPLDSIFCRISGRGVAWKAEKYRHVGLRVVLGTTTYEAAEPPPAPCQTFEVNGVSFNMMCVEGETYDYYIGQTEVTQGLWKKVMGYNNSIHQGEYLPVEKVSWEECQTFIQKLNEMTDLHFRLPTESEWEFAARGGKNSRGYTYAGSNSIDSVAWYQSNSQEQTHTIATLMPNELGIYDMSGNVWEWCEDHYDASAQRVVRGGSFYDAVSVCRISSRSGRNADYRSYIGLRLVFSD